MSPAVWELQFGNHWASRKSTGKTGERNRSVGLDQTSGDLGCEASVFALDPGALEAISDLSKLITCSSFSFRETLRSKQKRGKQEAGGVETPEEPVVLNWLKSYGICLGARAEVGAVEPGVEDGAGDAGVWWQDR